MVVIPRVVIEWADRSEALDALRVVRDGELRSERERSTLDDALHDDCRGQSAHARERSESIVVQRLEGRQVTFDDAQQVVGITEEPVRLQNVGYRGDGIFELAHRRPHCTGHRHEDQRLESQSYGGGVKFGSEAADGA